MQNRTEHAREQAARRKLAKQGYILVKSKCRNTTIDDHGGYRIVDLRNIIVAGEKFTLTLEDVEKWCDDE